jgi:signal transduction histidine kinase
LPQSPINSPTHSLRFVRRFAVIGAVIMLLSVGLIAPIRFHLEQRDIRATAEAYNESLAHTLSLFIRERVDILLQDDLQAASRQQSDGIDRTFDAAFAQLGRGSALLKVKLFDAKGTLIYSTDTEEIGEEGDEEDSAFAHAFRDKVVASDVTFRPEIDTLRGKLTNRNVVASYIPVFGDDARSNFIGLFEIYSDVTEREVAFRQSVLLETLLTLAIVGLGYAGLMLVILLGARDIDRAHQTSLAMTSSMAALRAAADAKTRLLMSMSHHLKTPLNAVIGFSEMIEGERLGPIGDKRYVRYAGDILDSGRRLLRGVDNILDYIRVDSGVLRVAVDLIAPQQLLQSVIREVADTALAADVSITCQELPAELGYLKTDPRYLRQILRNLADNAIRYNKAGGHVWLGGYEPEPGKVAFTVTDNGVGVAAEDLPGVFVPFGQKTDVLTQFQDGFGIGLPLCRRIAEMLGGSLTLERRAEGGMLATLILPREYEEPAATPI